MTLEEEINQPSWDEALDQIITPKKKSRAILLRETLLASNPTAPKLKSDTFIDLNDTKKSAENCSGNPLDLWFIDKLLPLKERNRPEKLKLKERKHHKVGHNEIKKDLEKALSVRRRQEHEQRIRFYNADNENFSDKEEDEEELEISDEEDVEDECQKENLQVEDDDKADDSGEAEDEIVDEEEADLDEEAEDEEIQEHHVMLDDEADDDDENSCGLELNEEKTQDLESVENEVLNHIDENSLESSGLDLNLDTHVPDTPDFDSKHRVNRPDLGLTQPNCKIDINSEVNMDELVLLCSGNFAESCNTEARNILASPTFSSQLLDEGSQESLLNVMEEDSLNTISVVPETQDDLLSNKDADFAISQKVNIADYFDDEDTLQDFERIDDDEDDALSRKRPINTIESDDEDSQIVAPPKRRLRFEDSDDDHEENESSQQINGLIHGAESTLLPQVVTPHNPPLQLDDELFTADYDDDNLPVDTAYYEDELDEDGGYKKHFTTHISDEDETSDNEAKSFKLRNVKDVFDDEASLSGDDVGSDLDDEGEELNEYEVEEGDADKLPDDEELRTGIVKQYLKQRHDEEDRRLIQIQETLFADGDLQGNGNNDRSFRYRWRGNMENLDDIDWTKFTGGDQTMLQDLENEELEMDTELKKRQAEMAIWKMKLDKDKDSQQSQKVSLLDDEMADSPLFEIGKKLITNKKSIPLTHSSDNSLPRDSLLNKAASLNVLLKETTTNNENRTTAAFRVK
uniref:Claspin n=1 Tax=Acrobeloides nanus TaxID=290746 RepID=A0A914BWL3_9BILA